MLETHHLVWLLDLQFIVGKYNPYADRLSHLYGNYLRCEKRINDCDSLDLILFNVQRRSELETYLQTEAKVYLFALEEVTVLIDGFESPFGMELL